MPTIEPITILTIDDTQYAVEAMSKAVQAQVTLFNEWTQDEMDLQGEILKVRAAKQELSRQIIEQFKKDQAATTEPAATEPPAV